MATLNKLRTWFNPFYLCTDNGADTLQINRVMFFNDGKVIAHTNWFQNNNPFKEIDLGFDVKRANKIDLAKKNAFYVCSNKDYEKSYDLYIPTNLLPIKSLGRVKEHEDWMGVTTYENFVITLNCIMCGEETKQNITTTFSSNYEHTNTEMWERCEELHKEFNIDHYTAHKILEKYDLVEKKTS